MRKTSPILLPEQKNEMLNSHVFQHDDPILPSINDSQQSIETGSSLEYEYQNGLYQQEQQEQNVEQIQQQQNQQQQQPQQCHAHQTNPFLIDDIEFFPNQQINNGNTNNFVETEMCIADPLVVTQNTSTILSFDEPLTTETNSINADFLNDHLIAQLQQQQQQHGQEEQMLDTLALNENENQLNANLLENEVINEIARPRQMGRRAETRPRIVSITAECCGEGNQVFYFYFQYIIYI